MKKVLLTLIASFAFCGWIFAQESYWPDIDSHLFEDQDPLVAMVSIDNHLVTPDDSYADYEVAAFVTVDGNEEYRGHGFMKHYAEYNDPNPILEFAIFYQPLENANELPLPIHFKLFDHNTQKLYDYCTSSTAFVTQTMYNDYNFNTMPTICFFTTQTKTITAYTENGGYYLITSPLNQEESPENVLNMISNEYDLYYFDQEGDDEGKEWITYKEGNGATNPGFDLVPGKGYLYANSQNVTLTFIGAPYNGDGVVTLDKKTGENVEFSGWNLVGNPFNQNAYIDRDFYVMNEDGSEIISADRADNHVEPMEGIFVIASEDGEELTFTTSPTQSKGQIVLNVTQDCGDLMDRAIVRFGEGGTLPKFMLNENNTKMYIPKDGKDFSVVRSNKSGKLPVNFKPAYDGVYFINVNTENVEVRYLHLIDYEEGVDVDLLQTPSYKFDARAEGKPNRFELVFKTGTIFDVLTTKDAGDSFGFCNNGNWIINNEGEAILQVVDVEGRILSSEEISGCVSKRIEAAPGVYMLRLINGNDVKVQKIVVE